MALVYIAGYITRNDNQPSECETHFYYEKYGKVPWETLAVREKHADMKTASKCNRKNPTNTLKLKKAQNELANIHLKEQTEYIQNQIDKIRDSVEDSMANDKQSEQKEEHSQS